jgi:hypothetical protein
VHHMRRGIGCGHIGKASTSRALVLCGVSRHLKKPVDG